jgi:oxygen-independent coproporphyrinogen-3 oxidase
MAKPLALYVHIPFCTAICNYCDFNAYAGHEHVIPSYAETLVREAQLWRSATAGHRVETVFFGGGTPSLVPSAELSSIFAGLRDAFEIAPEAEVSLEANPGGLEPEYIAGLRELGVTRLSIGAQSFHEDELRALDRFHSADDTRRAVAAARAAGFESVSLDLIYGLPEQPLERWLDSLEHAIDLAPDHLSLYALTVEEGTSLARDVERGRKNAPDADAQAEHYEAACERLATAGYEHYEISSWAKPDHRCRHNVTYWRCGEYLGLGAGAHSYFDGVRFAVANTPSQYLSLVDQSWQEREGDDAPMRHIVSGEQMTPELAMADALMLGLRLLDGVDLADYRERFSVDALDRFRDALDEPIAAGLLETRDGRLRLSARGRLLHNEVAVRLLPEGTPTRP